MSWILPNVYDLGYHIGRWVVHAPQQPLPSWLLGSGWDVLHSIAAVPALYQQWWWNLLQNDPIHVAVETTLLFSIVYMVWNARRTKGFSIHQDKLTLAEEKELLREWKQTRAPLTPTLESDEEDDEDDDEDDNLLTVLRVQGRTMTVQLHHPDHHHHHHHPPLQDVLNLATTDFLGLSSHPHVQAAAHTALDKYGCGSCGPRGFYGTVDVHLQLEETVATYTSTEQAILYSDGASTCSSTVAAFCKRGDLVVADEGIYEPLATGITLSRAHVKTFQHNNMTDLRNVLTSIQAKDRQLGRKPNAQRRFLVVEGLYKNSGTIVPLDQLVALKHEFGYRLILDETHSFGTLGPHGGGVAELYHQQYMKDCEIVTIGLEHAIGSVGGVTVGTEEVVEHQRLSGSGYCFSASAPPFTATAAMAALSVLEKDNESLLQRLTDNRVYLYEKLKGWCEKLNGWFVVVSDERSPLIVLHVAKIPETEFLEEQVFCSQVCRECLLRGVAVVALGRAARERPGIRMVVTADHTHADLDKALTALGDAAQDVIAAFREECKSI